METLWTATSIDNNYKELNKDLDVDILIIGGGIAGLSIAYNLLDSRKKVVLLEANRVGSGVTSRTTGKITYLQGHYFDIYKRYGRYVAKKYLNSQKEAIQMLKRIIEDNKIKCDLAKVSSYLFIDDIKYLDRIKEEEDILKDIGCKVEKAKNFPDKKKFSYGIKVEDTYTFHPLKYLYGLKKIINKKIPIYEKSRVLNIEKKDNYYLATCNNGVIKAKKIIVASHYPYFIKPFFMPLKVTLEKSYISAFADKSYNYSAISIDKKSTSIRFYKDGDINYKIYLYGSCNTASEGNISERFLKLKREVNNYNYLWSNIDIMTGDFLPFMGEIADNLYIATGYNTWGMTNGVLAGKVISDLVMGYCNTYEELFNPKRKIYSNMLLAMVSSFKSYTTELIFHKKKWYNGKVSFSKVNGKDVAIYIDNIGRRHIVYSKCPHLKCNLVFNEEEKTWDCPCHGSRFDIDGYVISGPSNYNIVCNEDKCYNFSSDSYGEKQV